MKLNFQGNIDKIEHGMSILGKQLGFENDLDGLLVEVCETTGNIKVEMKEGRGVIYYNKKIHFFRALGLLIEGIQKKEDFAIEEEPQFNMNGAMFDCSRNAVLKVESIKKMISIMALMGLDTIMLYTEDTYTLNGEAYFGYMRGRYTFDELKECDDYAELFGIEIIPCIQTLAHLEQFLKWKSAEHLKDSSDTLLVGEERVYKLIEEMIKSASAPFRSRRIHIGMDEAEGMGRGRYIDLCGHCDRLKAFTLHLNKVLEITKKNGLKPMLWSDMFFKLASKKNVNYDLDTVIPESITETIQKEIDLVAWEYYHSEQEFYETLFRNHKKFRANTVFAGGLWTWTGYCTNYGVAFVNSNAALAVCKREGIKEVFATMWGDDGGEDNLFTALLGLQLFAEHGYCCELDIVKLKNRVKFCTGVDFDAFMSIKYIDETPGAIPNNLDFSNPSKFLLFQDILTGLFDKYVEGLDLAGHYSVLGKKFKEYNNIFEENGFIFETLEKLCCALEIKSDIGIKIKDAYDKKNLNGLTQIADEQLPKLYFRVEELRKTHREQWFKTYKPFGWEVMDIRYGGVLMRIDTSAKRIRDYLEGRVDKIEELEEERLYFDGCIRPGPDKGLGVFNCYKRIATANIL